MSENRPKKDNKYLSSLNRELHSIMGSDPRVVVVGEDILDPYGGAFKVAKGLSDSFPNRIFTTPISESAIAGITTGLSMRGFRPVAEIMFGDFLMLAADQLVNHAAKFHWMYNDKVSVPMVIRTPMGGYRGYGPTHSQCLEKHFIGIPGLWVVTPSIIGEPGKLLRQALLDCEDPVLFIESKICYGKTLLSEIPDMDMEAYSDDIAPFPSIYLYHRGRDSAPDGLLFCYGEMVPFCLEAIEHLKSKERLYIDMVVVTQLSPTPETHISHILDKLKPALCIYAEESSTVGSWSSEIVAIIEGIRSTQKDQLPIRHVRIGSKYTPVPSSRELEFQALPQTKDIIQVVLNCF